MKLGDEVKLKLRLAKLKLGGLELEVRRGDRVKLKLEGLEIEPLGPRDLNSNQ